MFISFEGIDGSGKSAAANSLVRRLEEGGQPAIFVDRRRSTAGAQYAADHAKRLGDILWPRSPDEPQYLLGDQYFLHLTAAWLHLLDQQVVRPALHQNNIVVVDGWFYKAAARYSMRPSLSKSLIRESFAPLSRPNRVFMLNISPLAAAGRKRTFSNAESGVNDGSTGGANGFVDYQARVQEQLDRVLQEDDRAVTFLDANKAPEELVKTAFDLLSESVGR